MMKMLRRLETGREDRRELNETFLSKVLHVCKNGENFCYEDSLSMDHCEVLILCKQCTTLIHMHTFSVKITY